MKTKAYTLFETLLTLAIIGVVATLTLPSLSQNASKRTYVTQLKETHRALSNAVRQYMMDERETSLANTSLLDSASGVGTFLKKYLQVEVDCGTNKHSSCLASSYKSLDGSDSAGINLGSDFYCVKTVSSSVICMSVMGEDDDDYHGSSNVIIDVNGKKAPNTNGRDLFQFEIYSDGQISNGYDQSMVQDRIDACIDNGDDTGYGGNCFQRIASKGWVMDY